MRKGKLFKGFTCLILAVVMIVAMMPVIEHKAVAEDTVLFKWDGNGTTSATRSGENDLVFASSKTTMEYKKPNHCLKFSGNYSSGTNYIEVKLKEALVGGETIIVGAYYYQKSTTGAQFGIKFDGTDASDIILADEKISSLEDNTQIPADVEVTVPAEAAGTKILRIYRNCSSTLYVSRFIVTSSNSSSGGGGGSNSHTHVWVDDEITDATCTTDGSKTLKCSDEECSGTKVESIPALGHDYSGDYVIVTPATVNSIGERYKKCSRCDSKLNSSYTLDGSIQAVIDYPSSSDNLGGVSYNSGAITFDSSKKVISIGKGAIQTVDNESVLANYVNLTAPGGFKAGDIVTVTAHITNTGSDKYAQVAIYCDEIKNAIYTTDNVGVNNKTTFTYVLENDCKTIQMGRVGNTTLTIDAIKVESFGRFSTVQATLGDKIGLNFKALVPSGMADGAYVKFNVGGSVEKLPIAQATKDGNYYTFTCELTSTQMADDVTAELYYSDDTKVATVSKSVNDYLDDVNNIDVEAIANETEKAAIQKSQAIAAATKKLGAAMSNYVSDSRTNVDVGWTDTDATELGKYEEQATKVENDPSEMKVKYRRLSMGSMLSAVVTFESSEYKKYKFTVNGVEVTATEKVVDGKHQYVVKSPYIKAAEYGNVIEFAVTVDEIVTNTYSFAPLDYVKAYLNIDRANAAYDEGAEIACKSIFKLYEAVKA